MGNPKFSIVVPTYNRAHLIKRTLDSLLLQDYENYEIIVVDDGSTDNTEHVVTGINNPKIKYFKKSNAERGAARNFGRSKSEGEYINFFDSDDLAYPHHLSTAASMVDQHNTPEVFHLFYDIRDAKYTVSDKKPTAITNINTQLIDGNILSCNGVFIKKEIAALHDFHEDRKLSASEDYLLWLQLAARYTIHSSSMVTSSIVDHESRSVRTVDLDSLTTRKLLMIKYLSEDPTCKRHYKNNLSKISSNAYSYIALHGVVAENISNKKAIPFFYKSLKLYPLSLFTRRSLAIIKHYIFNIK